jgi:hypothetical protein
MNTAPQIKFVITSSKAKLSQSDIEYIRDYISKYIIDDMTVDDTIATISRHGLIPLVYHTLRDLSSDIDIPSTLLSKLQARYKLIAQKNMLMSAELIRIVKLLEENHIKAIPFKGAILSQLIYSDITLRQFGDLDILVNSDELFKTYQILSKLGYDIYGNPLFLKDPLWIKASKDMTFYHKTKKVVIELHWKLFHNSFAKNSIDIWQNTDHIKIKNQEFNTLNNDILLAYLCIHGSRHLWERLEWLVDIDRLIRVQTIDWMQVIKTAKTFQSSNMLYLGLNIVYSLYHTPLPSDIIDKISNQKIDKLTQNIIKLLNNPLSQKQTTKEIILRQKLHSQMQDSILNKIKYWKNIIFFKKYTTILEENNPNELKTLIDIYKPIKIFKKFFKL